MGLAGTSLVVATHVEIAYSHTGGGPVGLEASVYSREGLRLASTPTAGSSSAQARCSRSREARPCLVEGDHRGRSLFALANREINVRPDEICRGPPPFSMDCCGETTAREDEMVQRATPLLPNRADAEANIAEDLTWL